MPYSLTFTSFSDLLLSTVIVSASVIPTTSPDQAQEIQGKAKIKLMSKGSSRIFLLTQNLSFSIVVRGRGRIP